ncbi:MAG: zinc-dependent alcohol dehydrogenase family protein [Planctomycetota bacterium]|jgi:propanol-preferring alcohol dehydrogenase
MRAMCLDGVVDLRAESEPLRLGDVPAPEPAEGQVLLGVLACGVCHTEIDEIEGRAPPPAYPVIPGHEVVGRVVGLGSGAARHEEGDRVGVGWIWSSCGTCGFCRRGLENLCPDYRATGRDADGGYAELIVVPETSAFPIPERFSDAEAAPLFCAGAIGYRSLNLTGLENGRPLGLTGFGASGHLVLKMALHRFPDSDVCVFARNEREREFATELGAVWAGDTTDTSPVPLDAIIDTTPVWRPVVEALRNLSRGGRLVINAIRKEGVDQDSLLGLDYPEHLWLEKEVKSVANVAPGDIAGFLELADEIPIVPEVTEYPLEEANRALLELKRGGVRGAKVLRVSP